MLHAHWWQLRLSNPAQAILERLDRPLLCSSIRPEDQLSGALPDVRTVSPLPSNRSLLSVRLSFFSVPAVSAFKVVSAHSLSV